DIVAGRDVDAGVLLDPRHGLVDQRVRVAAGSTRRAAGHGRERVPAAVGILHVRGPARVTGAGRGPDRADDHGLGELADHGLDRGLGPALGPGSVVALVVAEADDRRRPSGREDLDLAAVDRRREGNVVDRLGQLAVGVVVGVDTVVVAHAP